ncbi:MAG: DoxX family protein [Sulfuriferula sp.]
MIALEKYGPLLGRLLIAQIFLIAGFGKLSHFAQTAGYMSSLGVPMANILLTLTIVIEIGGGLMILFGFYTRYAAVVFFLWLIPVTLTFHAFWHADAASLQNQMNNFMKNIAIMGAMIYLAVYGSGSFSLRRECSKKSS